MKMRLTNGSVRLRLSEAEVEQFRIAGRIEEVVEFGVGKGQMLEYVLEISNDADTVRATLSNNRISISVPREQAENWVRTDQVGIGAEQPTGSGRLRIHIEKDLKLG